MIEQILYDYLTATLSVPVYMQKPEKLTVDSYVVIEKTGSSSTNHIEKATVAIQSYGGSLYTAASLNKTVKAAMRNAPTQSRVSSSRLNTDYNFTDTATKQYRYQAVFIVTWYEED